MRSTRSGSDAGSPRVFARSSRPPLLIGALLLHPTLSTARGDGLRCAALCGGTDLRGAVAATHFAAAVAGAPTRASTIAINQPPRMLVQDERTLPGGGVLCALFQDAHERSASRRVT